MLGLAVVFGAIAVFLTNVWIGGQQPTAAAVDGIAAQDTVVVAAVPLRFGEPTDVPRALLLGYFGNDHQLGHPRVQARFREWEQAGQVRVIGGEDCYLKITGRLA